MKLIPSTSRPYQNISFRGQLIYFRLHSSHLWFYSYNYYLNLNVTAHPAYGQDAGRMESSYILIPYKYWPKGQKQKIDRNETWWKWWFIIRFSLNEDKTKDNTSDLNHQRQYFVLITQDSIIRTRYMKLIMDAVENTSFWENCPFFSIGIRWKTALSVPWAPHG